MRLRDDLHHLIDDLPEDRLPEVRRFLERAHFPADDEPVTSADVQAIDESRAELEHGDYVSLEALKRTLAAG